ncbi:MAG: SDR family NAD(P)-dependent oxidoreductase [Candidatus Aenigmarchaeota archaeon]|nr:SDR family NAD(P)-dependent oxidoreductase [Candidatus Aenigmarchaeota archaeon]
MRKLIGKNILVTGGTGFIGSHLCERLVKLGANLTILDNSFRSSKRNIESILDKVELVEADVRNFDIIKKSTKDKDIVIHLAAIQGTQNFYDYPDLVLDVGVTGTLNIVKSVVENKIKHLLVASSSEAYSTPQYFPTPETHPLIIPDPANPRFSYSSTKIISEMLTIHFAKKKGFDYTIFRPHNVYGPRLGWKHIVPEFIKRIVLNEEFTIQGDGSQTRSFCYIDDGIDQLILYLTKDKAKNQIFNLGNQKESTVNDIIRHLEEICGRKLNPKYVELPAGGTTRRNPDMVKAEQILDYEPKVGIKEGLKRTYDWYKKEIEYWLKNAKSEEYPWNLRR